MIARVRHYLQANRRCEQPAACVWLDTETDGLSQGRLTEHEHRLLFGWACHSQARRGGWSAPRWHRFDLVDECWDWLCALPRGRTTLWVFAHNLGYDFQVLGGLWELPARGWRLDWAILEDPPTLLQYSLGSKKLKFCDTLNWWKAPLSQIGAMVGVAKLPMPSRRAPRRDWDAYCRRDVEVIRTAVLGQLAWLRHEDLGGFALTAPAQAMRTFRHRFMAHRILVHDDADALALAREAYLGGRNEVLRMGAIAGPMHVLDVNSLYPSVMVGNPYPVEVLGTDVETALPVLARLVTKFCVIADVELTTEVGAYPHLIDGRLCFPQGSFRQVLAGPELTRALDRGHVVRCHRCACYRGARLFDDYVNYFYQRKLDAAAQGDAAGTGAAKLMLNSLSGKFGQRGGKWQAFRSHDDFTLRVWDEVALPEHTVTHWRQIGHLVQRREEDGESRESLPEIVATVTSYARCRLAALMTLAGERHVYYVDTDSLFVDDEGYANLTPEIDATRLGALKVVGHYDGCVIRGCKDYSIGGTTKTKGRRKEARPLSPDTVEQLQWQSLRGALHAGFAGGPVTRRITKHFARTYSKGVIAADGWVSPLVVDEPAGADTAPVAPAGLIR